MTGVAPVEVTDGTSTPSISVTNATTSDPGVVQLSDESAIDTTSTNKATTPKYVDAYYLIKNFSDLPDINA